MSKKLMSVILVAVLVLSMGTVAMASVSADELPEKPDGYNRYYFYMPESWLNDYATTAGIYWWEGTDACSAWPGYEANPTDVEGVYYYDVCQDVTMIIWNNAIDGGTDPEAPIYTAAYQIKDLGCEYYDPDESVNYPNGTDSFDEMIYVVDTSKTDTNAFSGKSTFSGEWFYYYGNGEYGFTPEKGDTYFNQRSYEVAPTPVKGDDTVATEPVATEPALEDGFAMIENPSTDGLSKVKVGDTITYALHTSTPENKNVEDFQGYVTYNSEYLKVVSAKSPAAMGAVINTNEAGTVYFNATEVNTGLNLYKQAVIAIDFEVLDAANGQTIDKPVWVIEEMTEFNGDSYFTDSEKVNDDVRAWDEMFVPTYAEPTDPATEPVATEPDATKAPVADVTGTTGSDDAEKEDVPPTGSNVALFAAIAVVAMAAAAVVVLRKKANA